MTIISATNLPQTTAMLMAYVENGYMMWDMRVIVPQTLQLQVLESLHANHSGITRMKATARVFGLN